MELEKIIDSLDDCEKTYYLSSDTNVYYDYIKNQEKYKIVLNKMLNDSLEDNDWDYIISKLYLILCKSIAEEQEIGLYEKFAYRFSDYCLSRFDDSFPLHQECFKIKKYIDGMEELKSLNMDLADGLHILIEDRDVFILDILLKQNEYVALFREYNNSFVEEYMEDRKATVSSLEYYNINMAERNYGEAKKLMLKYNVNNACND